MINCKLNIIDANGEAVDGATVRVGNVTGSTDQYGRFNTPIETEPRHEIVIEHVYYVTERVFFEGSVQDAPWNNSLVSRRNNQQDVDITVTLGRLDTCPTLELTDSDVLAISKTKPYDPGATLVFRPPRFSNGVKAYRFQWNDILTIQVARPALLPESPKADLPKGWARFLSDPVKVDIAALGRFFWLQYPLRPSSPKWVFAVWSPNLSAVTPLGALDFVVFFSPHTAAYVANYPYGLVTGSNPPDQQYMTLGKKYLVDEYLFVQQLLARRNRSILVMPICNRGEWGPSATGEGLLRALREVSVFLHRQCRTSQLGVMKPTDHPDSLAGLNQRTMGRSITSETFGTIPRVGRVVLAGFSTGIASVKNVMRLWPVPGTAKFWGVRSSAGKPSPQSVWETALSEIWDLDGYHPQTGGWPAYLDQLDSWYKSSGTRQLRLYHSSGRIPPDPLNDPHKLYKLFRGEVRLSREVPSELGLGGASILQGDRWTIVRMDNAYVDNGPLDERPLFIDAHHTTARIGFSHASGLTMGGK